MLNPVHFARAAMLAAGLALTGCATYGSVSQTEPVAEINNTNGVALKGYDAVAYFTDIKPVPGSPQITTNWHGATYRFASEAHRAAFVADPEHYAPQYGGFCAFAISRGTIADIDPSQFAVQNDRLYLNNNSVAQGIWNLDRPGNIRAGDRNWPLVPKKPVAAG